MVGRGEGPALAAGSKASQAAASDEKITAASSDRVEQRAVARRDVRPGRVRDQRSARRPARERRASRTARSRTGPEVFQRQERGPVQHAQGRQGEPGERSRTAGTHRSSDPVNSWRAIDRHAVQQVGEHEPDQERRDEAAGHQGGASQPRRQRGQVALAAVLKRHPAQGSAPPAAAPREPGRSRRTWWRTRPGSGEDRGRRQDEPDLVAVPQGADRLFAGARRPHRGRHARRRSTPKSNPSSTKKPIHKMVIRMNQNRITLPPRLSTGSRGQGSAASASSPAGARGQFLAGSGASAGSR